MVLQNTTISDVILYGTEDCHLCECAKNLLHAHQIKYHFIDITDHSYLIDQYAILIPVLSWHHQSMSWPFLPDILKQLSQEFKINE